MRNSTPSDFQAGAADQAHSSSARARRDHDALALPRAIARAMAPLPRHVRDGIARDLIHRLPRSARASQNIRCVGAQPYSFRAPLAEVIDAPWLALNSEAAWHVVAFDFDHADSLDRVLALPEAIRPWLMLDPHSGRGHAFLVLRVPVGAGDDASPKATAFLEFARRLVAAALDATALPLGALVKNPMGRTEALAGPLRRHGAEPATPAAFDAWEASGTPLAWHTVPGAPPVLLHQIVDALAPIYGEEVEAAEAAASEAMRARAARSRTALDPASAQRNVDLFDHVRAWAYRRRVTDLALIEAEALRANATFDRPLPSREVRDTAASIARFMGGKFGRRGGRKPGKPTMQDDGATAAERRAKAARATAAARARAMDERIAEAVAALVDAGAKVTQAAVAAEAGVSVRTVAARWEWAKRLAERPAEGAEPSPVTWGAGIMQDDGAAIRMYASARVRAGRGDALPASAEPAEGSGEPAEGGAPWRRRWPARVAGRDPGGGVADALADGLWRGWHQHEARLRRGAGGQSP